MKISLKQLLQSLALASLPASVVYVVAGHFFIPRVAERPQLGLFLFVFFFVLWLLAALVYGSLAWVASFRKHRSWARISVVPALVAAFLLSPGVNGDMPFTRTLPMPLALVTLFGIAFVLASRLGAKSEVADA